MFKTPHDRSIPILLFIFLMILLGKTIEGLKKEHPIPERLKECKSQSDCLLDGQKMNLNKVMVVDLKQIPKISRKVAEGIVALRNQKGMIRSFEELDSVTGIGPKTLERLKQYLEIQAPRPLAGEGDFDLSKSGEGVASNAP